MKVSTRTGMYLGAFGLGLALSGIAGAATADGGAAAYKAAYAAASAKQAEAVKAVAAWTPTEKALKESKEAAKKGDYAKATKLANEADELAKLSLKQADEQKTGWKKFAKLFE